MGSGNTRDLDDEFLENQTTRTSSEGIKSETRGEVCEALISLQEWLGQRAIAAQEVATRPEIGVLASDSPILRYCWRDSPALQARGLLQRP